MVGLGLNAAKLIIKSHTRPNVAAYEDGLQWEGMWEEVFVLSLS